MMTVEKDIAGSFLEQNGKDFVFNIKKDFVAFKGHFPGQPLLPGIVQIELALFCIRKFLNDKNINISEISKVKFVKPVLPDTQITVSLEIINETCKAVIKDARKAGEIYSHMQLGFSGNS